jgi:glycosyltransferase involved in cell wall biosynthesis
VLSSKNWILLNVNDKKIYSQPKITVITPAYNAAKTIESTIQSVLSQKYMNLEYIVIDGASNDGTVEIIKKYESSLTFWISESDDGQYHAIQKGFDRATGEIYCWLNADDMFLPGALWLVGDVFSRFPSMEWLSTLKPGWWDANDYFTGCGETPGFSKEAFLDGLNLPGMRSRAHWIQQESTFWRRGLWERAGSLMPKNTYLAGDFALWANFYEYAELYGIDYPLAGFRTLEGQRSEEMQKYLEEANECFADLRRRNNYKSRLINIIRYCFLGRFPKIRRLLARHFGYEGKKIVNVNPRLPGAGWKIEGHCFLP